MSYCKDCSNKDYTIRKLNERVADLEYEVKETRSHESSFIRVDEDKFWPVTKHYGLTASEGYLLACLYATQLYISRHAMLDNLRFFMTKKSGKLGNDDTGGTNMVSVMACRIRHKIRTVDGDDTAPIDTIWGVGLQMNPVFRRRLKELLSSEQVA